MIAHTPEDFALAKELFHAGILGMYPKGPVFAFESLQGSQMDGWLSVAQYVARRGATVAEIVTPVRRAQAITRTLGAIKGVRKAFGPPGEYGYDSKEGKALLELYDAHNDLNDACPAPAEKPKTEGGAS